MTKKLSSLDGNLAKAVFGSLIEGDASTPLAEGWYVVKSLAAASTLPTNLQEKYIFFSDTGITPAVGDDVYPVTFTTLCDIQNASLEFTKDEIESTTLCDLLKTYLAGRSDASGTVEGITTLGITDEADGFINKFINKIKQVADLSSVTITEANNNKYYMQLEINKDFTGQTDDRAFFFFPAVLLSFQAGFNNGDAQSFSSNYRIASDDFIIPQFFELEQPVV